ncbi:anti-sigma factor [uncultured Arthrobacter sp.]|uniref:anti-sigma factor family protein n=1 Tax=uncultured Arthrobacter sp. TaxID=114050 RepID=UPI00262DC873|nr:zf-HC2 domain-containing protein [uncultured Arthrobacter sp.]
MRHPTRFLIDYVAGELSPARQRAVEKHLLRCARCHEVVEQEQAIRRRLRSTSTPGPSEDLCERILRRSAGKSADRELEAAETEGVPFGATDHEFVKESFVHRNRAVMAVGSGLTVAAVATLTAAYALGSEVDSDDVIAGGSASVTESFQTVAAGTPADLSPVEIEQLRDDGWFCPELQTLGFELVGAEAREIDGRPTLQLDLSDGSHSLTIYEQRGDAAEGSPVNAATGRTVQEDGFEEIGGTEQTVWLHPGRAWQLVIDSESATYTVVSTLPVADMPRAVSQLMFNEHSQLAYSRPDAPSDPLSRILRGLGKLAQPAP